MTGGEPRTPSHLLADTARKGTGDGDYASAARTLSDRGVDAARSSL